jgi:hypothetical protein
VGETVGEYLAVNVFIAEPMDSNVTGDFFFLNISVYLQK